MLVNLYIMSNLIWTLHQTIKRGRKERETRREETTNFNLKKGKIPLVFDDQMWFNFSCAAHS